MTRVLTVGTFSVPHLGHYFFLKAASRLGDELIVGINADEYVLRYKKEKPILDGHERTRLISRLPFVSETFFNHDDSLQDILENYRPNFLAIGSDWGDRYLQQIRMTKEDLTRLNCALVYLPYTSDISTTLIKERMRHA